MAQIIECSPCTGVCLTFLPGAFFLVAANGAYVEKELPVAEIIELLNATVWSRWSAFAVVKGSSARHCRSQQTAD
jgi:hypothetical protein